MAFAGRPSLARMAAGEGVRPARLRSIPGIGLGASPAIFPSVQSPLGIQTLPLTREATMGS